MTALAVHVATAEAMTRAGNFAAARGHINKALEIDPESPAARRALFLLELNGGSPYACLEVAEDWVEIAPGRLDAHVHHFVALCRGSLQREARRKLDSIAERFKVPPQELGELGLHYARQFGDPHRTARDIAAHRAKYGGTSALDRLDMAVQFRAGIIFGAAEAARKVLARSPDDAEAHLVLAMAAYWRGRFARARAHARDFIRTRPTAAVTGREIILAGHPATLLPGT